MFILRLARTWLIGWQDLLRFGSIPGYSDRAWFKRKRIDLAALWHLLATARFRSAVLLLVATQIIVLCITWQWDLEGWRRDLLRAAPGLFVLPWFATARRITIESMLGHSNR